MRKCLLNISAFIFCVCALQQIYAVLYAPGAFDTSNAFLIAPIHIYLHSENTHSPKKNGLQETRIYLRIILKKKKHSPLMSTKCIYLNLFIFHQKRAHAIVYGTTTTPIHIFRTQATFVYVLGACIKGSAQGTRSHTNLYLPYIKKQMCARDCTEKIYARMCAIVFFLG